MSINGIKAKMWEVELLGEDLCGLNEVYRDIADEIGIENAVVIYRLFHGTQISFPNRLFSKDYIHKAIVNEYNGSITNTRMVTGRYRDIRGYQTEGR